MSVADSQLQNLTTPENELRGGGRLDVHVVILNNYVRKHHVVAYQALSERVRKLTILLSVPMEPDRNWDAAWEDLDVRVQKNWMLTTRWKHSTGFQEPNYIHIPVDTYSRLKSLQPDIVFSYEMGMRTFLSSWYRRFHRIVPLVMVGNMSQRIERERGWMRRTLRSMIRRGVDYCTYNGPSCKRYLQGLAIEEERLFHVPYCIDPEIVFRGERSIVPDAPTRPKRFLYCGALSERKGILPFAKQLQQWCRQHPDQFVELSIAGSGELQSDIAACQVAGLAIKFLGNCDVAALRTAYGLAEICVFPSLADEWGLVPIEALASGVPVLGSTFAQSVEAVVQDSHNGWVFDPTNARSLDSAIDRAMRCTPAQLHAMGQQGKRSVAHINGRGTAEKICDLITAVLPKAARLPNSFRRPS